MQSVTMKSLVACITLVSAALAPSLAKATPCPVAGNTTGTCSSSLPVTDPLGLGVVSITWEQEVVYNGGASLSYGEDSITAKGVTGAIKAQVITSFNGSQGQTAVWSAARSGAIIWNTTGAFLRDSLFGDAELEDTLDWLKGSLEPDPTELKEDCNSSGGHCWCQCTTDSPWDHLGCAAYKIAAAASGEEYGFGWWYTQDGAPHKCK